MSSEPTSKTPAQVREALEDGSSHEMASRVTGHTTMNRMRTPCPNCSADSHDPAVGKGHYQFAHQSPLTFVAVVGGRTNLFNGVPRTLFLGDAGLANTLDREPAHGTA